MEGKTLRSGRDRRRSVAEVVREGAYERYAHLADPVGVKGAVDAHHEACFLASHEDGQFRVTRYVQLMDRRVYARLTAVVL